MSTESTGKDIGIRRGIGHLMVNRTGQYGGGMVIESLEELVTFDPMPTIIALINDIRTNYNAHISEGGNVHDVNLSGSVVTTAVATDEATAYTLANAIKTAYNLHCALGNGAGHVDGADATNTTAAAAATTTATLVALVEELRADYEAHRASTACHGTPSGLNTVDVANYAGVTCTTAIFPAGSWGLGVCTYVKEGMATAVNFDVGTAGALTSYISNQLDTTALASQHLPSGNAILPYATATALVLTPDATPTSRSGRVYVQIHFMRLRALAGSPSA